MTFHNDLLVSDTSKRKGRSVGSVSKKNHASHLTCSIDATILIALSNDLGHLMRAHLRIDRRSSVLVNQIRSDRERR